MRWNGSATPEKKWLIVSGAIAGVVLIAHVPRLRFLRVQSTFMENNWECWGTQDAAGLLAAEVVANEFLAVILAARS